MFKLIATLIIQAAVISLACLYHAEAVTGNDYLAQKVSERQAYVVGMWDTMTAFPPFNGELICPPTKGLSYHQIYSVFEKFLKENPERTHDSAPNLFHWALFFAFPCPIAPESHK